MMRTKTTIMLVALYLLVSSPANVLARVQDKPSEEAAITQVIEAYFDGWKNDDVESIKRAFQPHAKWYSLSSQNSLVEISQSQVYAALNKNAKRGVPKKQIMTRIIMIDISGDVASAKVEMSYPEAIPYVNSKTTEYLSLIKFSEGWKIVSKVTHVEQKGPVQPGG